MGGVVFFGITHFSPPTVESKDVLGRNYVGYVVEHDPTAHTIRIAVPSSYSFYEPTTDVQFAYDDATFWGAMNYGFEGDTLLEKKTQTGRIDTVPTGALVKITRTADNTGPLHAAAIVLYKRSTL
jgi:hypothetical protein